MMGSRVPWELLKEDIEKTRGTRLEKEMESLEWLHSSKSEGSPPKKMRVDKSLARKSVESIVKVKRERADAAREDEAEQ